jgi:chaperonin GroEL
MKQIEFDREAREKLETGVQKLNRAVSSTLGAKGRNVIFQHGGKYLVTKDGVTVANNVTLDDPTENAAAQIVKDAAARTARDAGDGTTTATVLASAIIDKALQYVGSKSNPMDLKRGIDLAVTDVIEYIDSIKKEVNGYDDILSIATISANNDPKIGKMIADIFKTVGEHGAVKLEETQATETVVDVVEGAQFNTGYASPNFITNLTKRTIDYEDVAILITDKVFNESINDLAPALELIIEKSNETQRHIPLLIISGGIEGEVLNVLVLNKMKDKAPWFAVNPLDFGDERIETLDDIAFITGGTVMSEDRGLAIKDMTLEHFGTAKRVIVDQYTTTIIGRNGDAEQIEQRVETIKTQQEEDKLKRLTWRLNKRIATLTGGVGVIHVGGNSETEMKDNFYRIEDALAATKAAMEDGFVPGGGVALLNASHNVQLEDRINRDIELGYDTVIEALESPMRVIAENSGIEGSVVVDMVLRKRYPWGYNALTDKYENIVKAGIIDPAKVVKTALKNAASVAGMLITTNCVINDKPKK